MQPPALLPIVPTRVRRNYRGGLQLDRLEGRAQPQDSDRPESWIASSLQATNPDFPPEPGEGLTRVRLAGGESTLKAQLDAAPDFYLGPAHVQALGCQLGFLEKLLDSAMRLHVQVHPTSHFARTQMNAPYGKLEVYYILGIREGCEGYIRLGFQNAPSKSQWRRIIAEQDIAAMDACFAKIPVKKGDVWLVPGGLPHAIGEGVLTIEIMEPSDLVVRCEFERDGVVLPPNSRFMGRDLDFCLEVFDYRSQSPEQVQANYRLQPDLLVQRNGWQYSQLVSAAHTSCFELFRLQASQPGSLAAEGRCALVVQTEGAGVLSLGSQEVLLESGDACFVAASSGDWHYQPHSPLSELIITRPLVP